MNVLGKKPRLCEGPLPLSQRRKGLCQTSDIKVGAARRLDRGRTHGSLNNCHQEAETRDQGSPWTYGVPKSLLKIHKGDVLGGSVVKTSPSNTRGAGSIPGRGPEIPHALEPKHKTEAIL